MKKIIILSSLIFLSHSIYADDDNKNCLVFNLKLNSKDKLNYITETSREQEEHKSAAGVNLKFFRAIKQINEFTFSVGLGVSSEKEGGVIAKDSNITYATGGQVRMVKTKADIEDNAIELLGLVSYKKPLGGEWTLRPFAGAGIGLGQFKSTQDIMTDKKNPNFFSTHNHYALANEKQYNSLSIDVGTSLDHGNWSVVLDGNIQRAINIKSQNSAPENSDDGVTFSEKDYQIVNIELNRASITLGLGYKF